MLTVSVVQAPHTFKSWPVISDILLQKGGEHSDCMMQVIVPSPSALLKMQLLRVCPVLRMSLLI